LEKNVFKSETMQSSNINLSYTVRGLKLRIIYYSKFMPLAFWIYLFIPLAITELCRILKITNLNMPLPLWVNLEPTTKCNFNCITCSRISLSPSRLNKSLSFNDFKHIIHEIPQIKRIHMQGLGEPLLNQDIWKMAKYANAKGIKLTTTINGSLINPQNVDNLLKYFSGIAISIDSVNEENFNKIRIGGNYRQLIANIRFLLERKNRLNAKTIIISNYVVTHLNFSELEDYLKFCLNFQLHSNIDEIKNLYCPYQRQYKEETEFIKESRKFHNKIVTIISKYKKVFEKNSLYLNYESIYKRKKICFFPFITCFISFDGFVAPCCMRQDPAAINFGNIFKTPFKKIWNSVKLKMFRNTLIRNLPNIVCDNCPD